MNVYFIDPTYVKPEGWKPLLTFLKVKAVYSFVTREELPESLISIIKPFLKAIYSNQNLDRFADNCAFWLRAHFEKHINLITDDVNNIKNIKKEEWSKYSSRSAYHNLIKFNSENCLILLNLKSSYNDRGCILAPKSQLYTDTRVIDLPTHITTYCLNILHKKYNHHLYTAQSSFIVFSEHFNGTYVFNPKYRKFEHYSMTTKTGRKVGLMLEVNRAINRISPGNFPLKEEEGKKRFTLIINEKGCEAYKHLVDAANEQKERYEDELYWQSEGDDWQREVEDMNRAFWRECGEAGSNCESWSGWD